MPGRRAETAEQGHITERISKAVEQIGAEKTVSRQRRNQAGELVYEDDKNGTPDLKKPVLEQVTEPNLEVRIGGIYALERIAQDSERDHIQIMEILCAYVRENARDPRIDAEATAQAADKHRQALDGAKDDAAREALGDAPTRYLPVRADIQAAMTVLGRRWEERRDLEVRETYTLDLRNADLARVDLTEASLANAQLDGTNLQEAKLWGANLQKADLGGANLQEAKLLRANLQEAKLGGANLQEAKLGGANLQKAKLWRANLQEAKLRGANLQKADLWGANLSAADLRNWTCACAFLRSAVFKDCTGLTEDAVNTAFGVKSGSGKTVLPDGMTAPDWWYGGPEGEVDAPEAYEACWRAYKAWLKEQPDAGDG